MATWPGKDSNIDPVVKGSWQKWKVTLSTRMPSPCNRKIERSSTQDEPDDAMRRAQNLLNHEVRQHINECKKCQANNVRKP